MIKKTFSTGDTPKVEVRCNANLDVKSSDEGLVEVRSEDDNLRLDGNPDQVQTCALPI